jgi:hypothetical protein
MTFKVKAIIKGYRTGETREVVTNFAGCHDVAHAAQKMHELWPGAVVRISRVTPVEPPPQTKGARNA